MPWILPDRALSALRATDNFHIQGSDAVASQVVFVDGMPAKQHYRHYKIKNPEVRAGHSTTLPAWPRSFVAGSAAMLLTRTNPALATPTGPTW